MAPVINSRSLTVTAEQLLELQAGADGDTDSISEGTIRTILHDLGDNPRFVTMVGSEVSNPYIDGQLHPRSLIHRLEINYGAIVAALGQDIIINTQ
jgi:hypothetical protein